jgi:hypothetical protein
LSAGRILAIAAIGLLFPHRLPAQEVGALLDRAPYEKPSKEAIRRLFDRAQAQSIPADLLLPRLEEGLAKKVAPARLLQALERELDYLERARAILLEVEEGPRLLLDSASWARTANLLAAGTAEAEVRHLVRLWRARWPDYRPATWLYAALLRWGLSRPAALALLEALQASVLPGDSFAGIQDLLLEGRRLRLQPEELADRMVRRMPQVRSVEELKESVLHDPEGGSSR